MYAVGVDKPCLLSQQLTRAMDLGSSCRAVYTEHMLQIWWSNYVMKEKLIFLLIDDDGQNTTQVEGIHPNEFMNSLFGTDSIAQQYDQPFDFLSLLMLIDNHIDHQTPITITSELATSLYREYQELKLMFRQLNMRPKWFLL